MKSCIGVDVGGTFTDLIAFDALSGRYEVCKRLTTRAAPEEGVLDAVSDAVSPDGISSASYFVHGTTVALNALLERKHASVGLLTTRGFRDVLEIRRGDRAEPYNLFWKPRDPLVPRRLRLPVTERIRADGSVDCPLDEKDVLEALAVFSAYEVSTLAIAFLHSYANPAHELLAHDIVRDRGFTGEISLSHRVTGEFREYERTSTTTIDAYVGPFVSCYLRSLETGLGEQGFRGTTLITRSGGGAFTFAEADGRAVETILSGPVAGAQGAATLARTLELSTVITADVGGTSFDTCLIRDGHPQLMYEGEVAGLPVQTPWVDIRSIGAGGGSIARVDVGGLLQVGPLSAGADPGPACYGRGGRHPTVTDAAFALGMLGAGRLAAGVTLDLARARAALEPLRSALRLSVDGVAQGIMTIAAVAMANAIREITVERGEDPRTATLMAFGGAGPLFATLLASELDIKRVVVPQHAGNFSAWGLLHSDVSRSAARTQVMKLSPEALQDASTIVEQLFDELDAREALSAGIETVPSATLDLRYQGQEHSLTVPVMAQDRRLAADAGTVHDLFTAEYLRAFGHTMDEEVEIVHVRATTRASLADVSLAQHQAGRAHVTPATQVPAFSFREGRRLPFEVLDRSGLQVGDEVAGPLLILEATATSYVDSGYAARIDPTGCLVIEVGHRP